MPWCAPTSGPSISGTQLRLVVTAQIVRRVLSLNGLDRLVSDLSLPGGGHGRRGASGRVPPLAADPAETVPGAAPGAARATGQDGPGAAITPARAGELVDALADGVALADDDGTLALVNRRLEEMFGYEHGELAGQPVESLIPADLRGGAPQPPGRLRAGAQGPADGRGRTAGRAAQGREPRSRSRSASARCRPRPASFTLAVIRDVTGTRRREDLADLARAAVAAEQAHRGQELLDRVVDRPFHVGLSLQAAIDLPPSVARQRIADALQRLDDTIREIRDNAFTIRDHDDPLSRGASGHHQTATVAGGRNQQVSRPVVPG